MRLACAVAKFSKLGEDEHGNPAATIRCFGQELGALQVDLTIEGETVCEEDDISPSEEQAVSPHED